MFRNIQQVKRTIAAKEVSDNAFLSCNISCTQTSGVIEIEESYFFLKKKTPPQPLNLQTRGLSLTKIISSNEDGQNTSNQTADIQPQVGPERIAILILRKISDDPPG